MSEEIRTELNAQYDFLVELRDKLKQYPDVDFLDLTHDLTERIHSLNHFLSQ